MSRAGSTRLVVGGNRLASIIALCCAATVAGQISPALAASSVVVGTGQDHCYNYRSEIPCPRRGEPYYGQDVQHSGKPAQYRDPGDGTIIDLMTNLTWSRAVDSRKLTPEEAQQQAQQLRIGGFSDWRVPTIKELYSLIDFRGYTGFEIDNVEMKRVPANAIPFLNTDYFNFRYGNIRAGERYIDAQWLSSTPYVSTTMRGDKTIFGVNFADGRLKGYGYLPPGKKAEAKRFYVRFVRGAPYGLNQFQDNGDGTITDHSSGLMWSQQDSGKGMKWADALQYAANSQLAGFRDWRLPSAKELQYIVDYTRSPETSNSAAIDPIFHSTPIRNEAGKRDFAYYWSSTTHLDGPQPGRAAVYVAFGRAMGQMKGKFMDVHGAGAQRSDPKEGEARIQGPQGDVQRILNMVRLVRGGEKVVPEMLPVRDGKGYPEVRRILEEEGDDLPSETLVPPRPVAPVEGKAAAGKAAAQHHKNPAPRSEADAAVNNKNPPLRSEAEGAAPSPPRVEPEGRPPAPRSEMNSRPPPPPRAEGQMRSSPPPRAEGQMRPPPPPRVEGDSPPPPRGESESRPASPER
ncbi:DUF1566 domain-containing protein [Candidatus Magnetaquicoccus inordinatus]|uniref:Lcl C-terminal domain-containing protein n=1 Tax=Candidatus Magnetaquicoccus inordinatus TaxID=2496818 RepID=UPI00102CA334|nr:DUF1566 domain-containing protein [Candidatus Magnetaquicoccus inordinatus]